MSDNESDGSDPSPIRSKVVAINIPNNDGDKDGFSYTFKLELCKSWEYEESHTTVSVNLKFIPDPTSPPAPKNIKTGEDGKRDDNNAAVVGQLRGNILKRPSPIFFEMADEESAELQGLACLFLRIGWEGQPDFAPGSARSEPRGCTRWRFSSYREGAYRGAAQGQRLGPSFDP
mmetsp:Transcript_6264/g.11440  ORF Transcript_6264/g.11440 Transcript_6264/m.11440 type:complete len:174 (+) Transcript_6264:275-796(+)